MQRIRWAGLVAAIAIGTITAIGFATSGGAATEANTLTVEKVVIGTADSGTIFHVEVDCGDGTTVVQFKANGDPVTAGDNVFSVGAGHTCTVNETVNGGATSVAYQCEMTFGDTDKDHILASCTDDNEAHFGDVVTDAATITVTNTFETPTTTTTTTTTLPPAAQPEVVQVAPTFTG